MAKKTITAKNCIRAGCGAKITGSRKGKMASQYCAAHVSTMKTLKGMRAACPIILCRNPAHEDGYCEKHRPFDADYVPFREDWLSDEDSIPRDNNPRCFYTKGMTSDGTYRSKEINARMKRIREGLGF